jgi:hypothetical protein
MSEVRDGFGSKLENLFLAILRVVILIVLAVSLIGSLALGIWGIKDLDTKAAPYKAEPVDNKALIQELKKSLESSPADSQPSPRKPNSPASPKVENKALEEELEKQLKLASSFLSQFNRSLTNPDGFKRAQRNEATSLAPDPKSEASVLAYAKGQTELFTLAFSDQEIITILKKKDDAEILGKYFEAAANIYPTFFKEQRNRRKEFEAEEASRVVSTKEKAMFAIYVAGGMFGAFLLISLILVLVKIERNLRVRPI